MNPVNAVPRDSDQPAEHFLSAVTSYRKSELAKNGRLAKEGDDALKIDIKVIEFSDAIRRLPDDVRNIRGQGRYRL